VHKDHLGCANRSSKSQELRCVKTIRRIGRDVIPITCRKAEFPKGMKMLSVRKFKARQSALHLCFHVLSWNQHSNLFRPEITGRPLYMFLFMWNEENLWGLWNCTSNKSKLNLGLNITIKLNETLIDLCMVFSRLLGPSKAASCSGDG